MKKLIAMILSVGLLLGSQLVYAENIAPLDLVPNSSTTTAAFAGDRLATVNLQNSPDFRIVQVSQADAATHFDTYMASNHNLIPEKIESSEKIVLSNQPGLDLRPHNLFYLTLLN